MLIFKYFVLMTTWSIPEVAYCFLKDILASIILKLKKKTKNLLQKREILKSTAKTKQII